MRSPSGPSEAGPRTTDVLRGAVVALLVALAMSGCTERPDLTLSEEQRAWCRDNLGEVLADTGGSHVDVAGRQIFNDEPRGWNSEQFSPVYDVGGNVVAHDGIGATPVTDAEGRTTGFEEDGYYPEACRISFGAAELRAAVPAVVELCSFDELAGDVSNHSDSLLSPVQVDVVFVGADGEPVGGGGIAFLDDLEPGETRKWHARTLTVDGSIQVTGSDVFPAPGVTPDDIATCDVRVIARVAGTG